MSWDVSLIRWDPPLTVADFPTTQAPLPLGTRDEFCAAVDVVFRGTSWAIKHGLWGSWVGPDGSVEFNCGDEDPIVLPMLHVRAAETVVPRILELAATLHCQAYDNSIDDFITTDDPNPAAGLKQWSKYRDRMRGGPGPMYYAVRDGQVIDSDGNIVDYGPRPGMRRRFNIGWLNRAD